MNSDDIKNTLDKKSSNAVAYYNITEEEVERENMGPQIIDTQKDTVLDPTYDKEYFLKNVEVNRKVGVEGEVGEYNITLKTLGIGRNKPISVYINDARWELFAGPARAEKEATNFIRSKQFEAWALKNGVIKSKEDTVAAAKFAEDEKDEKEEVKENILQKLNWSCNQGKSVVVEFGNTDEQMKVDPKTSEILLRIRESLNNKNGLIYDRMLSESKFSFLKLVGFGINNTAEDNDV